MIKNLVAMAPKNNRRTSAPKRTEPFPIIRADLLVAYNSNAKKGNIAIIKVEPLADAALIYIKKPACRAVENFKASDVIIVDFGSVKMSPKDTEDFIMQRIESGVAITVGGSMRVFHFYGCSNSQLKEHRAYFLCRSVQEIESILKSIGEFTMNTIGKRMKRIGLLFSASSPIQTLNLDQVGEIEDIETESGELLTDGCGFVSKQFAQQISRKANIVFRENRYLPSVYQFRLLGYKGVLSLQPTMPPEVKIQCRPSMRKFNSSNNSTFGLVKTSKPYSFGSLNAEHVTLLVAMGIQDETIIQKQADYHDFLRAALSNTDEAFQLMVYQDEFRKAENLLEHGIMAMQQEINSSVRKEIAKGLNQRGERRVRIVLRSSRLLFGIAEPDSRLGPNDCYVRITVNGQPQTLTGWVLVTRNPCLHPGDFRRLRAVDVPEYHHLVDCIVFSTSTRLRRSHAAEMSGGDLDGDEFMVIFDEDLQPKTIFKPFSYPPANAKQHGNINRTDMLRYFARFNSSSVGRIKNLYLKWVAERGLECGEALELCALFSKCIDGERMQIPEKLFDVPELTTASKDFIVNRLTAESVRFASGLVYLTVQTSNSEPVPFPTWESIVFDNYIQAISSFEVFRFLQRSKHLTNEEKEELYAGIDFASFTFTQRQWVSEVCPSLQPRFNALNQSELLTPHEAEYFNLSQMGFWKRLYTYSNAGPGFSDRIIAALSMFERKLIVLNAGPYLTVVLFIKGRLEQGINNRVDVHVFSTNHTGFKSKAYLKDFCLDLDQGLLQISRSAKRNTFIWMSTCGNEIDTKKGMVGKVSIDLGRLGNKAKDKFDLITKAPLQKAEIFVLAAEDTHQLEVLHFPLKEDSASPTLRRAGVTSCRHYRVDLEADWLQLPQESFPISFQERSDSGTSSETIQGCIIDMVRKDGDKNQIEMNCQLLRSLFSQASQYHIASIAADVAFLFSDLVSESIQFLPDLPVLAIPLCSLGKGPATETFKALLRCFSHSGWGAHAMELVQTGLGSVLEEVKRVEDLIPLLDFVAVSTCMSQYSTELRDWLLAWHDSTSSSDDGEFREALRVFVDLHATLQDSVYDHKNTPSLSYLHLVAVEDKPGLYSADRKQSEALTPPRRGDVFLFEAMAPPSNAPNYRWPSFPGIVQDVEEFAILFNFECAWLPFEVEQADWQAKAIGNITTSRAMLDALSREQLSAGSIEGSDNRLLVSTSLNESQSRAVTTALIERVSLLWGPPGCGKSFTVIQLLRELMARGERILVTASTHQAVDNILRTWAEHYTSEFQGCVVLRLGDFDQVESSCKQWTLDFHPLMKNKTTVYQVSKESKKLVKEAKVIFSTATGAGLGLLRKDFAFDTVLVDEAGQLTSANTRVATSKALNRIVLIGDHQQLRATTHEKARELGFDKSMFERLREKDYPCVMLDVQYRMHPSLIKFSSDKFYNGKIKSSESTLGLKALKSAPWMGKSHAVWVDADQGREQRDGTSYSNIKEAELILKFIRALIDSNECSPSDIGVITGYSAQKECIKRLVSRYSTTKGVAVRTVDGFQGQERRVIFFSAVRTERQVGFLKDYHRMNVMFTRSKQGLAVVGRKTTLELDPLWKEWIQKHDRYNGPS